MASARCLPPAHTLSNGEKVGTRINEKRVYSREELLRFMPSEAELAKAAADISALISSLGIEPPRKSRERHGKSPHDKFPRKDALERSEAFGGKPNCARSGPEQEDDAARDKPTVFGLNAVRGQLGEEEVARLELEKKVRGLLNKITVENYEKICQQILALPMKVDSCLFAVVLLVFDKAVGEKNFSHMYAVLCKELSLKASSEPGKFRKNLLNLCQNAFLNRNDKSSLANITDPELLQEKEIKLKIRKTGLIRFIGELCSVGLLHKDVIHSCVEGLLSTGESDEQDFESCCRLLMASGKIIDSEREKKLVDRYFSRLAYLSKRPELEVRLRFLAEECAALRADKWVARRPEEGPMKIEDVRKASLAQDSSKISQGKTWEAPKDARREAPRDTRREAPKDARREAPRDTRREAPRDTRREAPKDARWDTRREASKDARKPSPAAHKPSPAAHKPSPAAHKPSPAAPPSQVQKKGYIVLEDLGNEMPQVKSRPSPKKSPQKAQESPKKSPQKAQESPKKSPEKPRAASPFSQKNVNVLDSIIREFLMAQDLEETCLSYKEIGEQGTRPEAVCHLLSRMLESSVKERTLYKKLIVRLESDIALVEGFRLFSEKIESFLEDFPKVGSFIGELIGSLKASLPFLNTVREDNSLKESGIAGEILGGYLKAVPEAELEKEYVKGFYKEQA